MVRLAKFALLLVLNAGAVASADVAYDTEFKVNSEPGVWSTNSEVCFTVDKGSRECARVTNLGEVFLRQGNATPADVEEKYLKLFSPDEVATVRSYKQLVVRYLSLDGTTDGRYIVQILQSVSFGSQAIYVYGNFKTAANGIRVFEPMGYGDTGHNLSFLRTKENDQKVIAVAQHVISIWAANQTPASSTVPAKP